MGRIAQPWWWDERKGYYATIRGVRHRLGTSLKAAQSKLKELAKEGDTEQLPARSLALLLDDFLAWTHENRAQKTYRGYKDFCQSFLVFSPRLTVDQLTPQHVTAWLAKQESWSSTTKRGGITCLQRALNWGVKNAGLKINPLRAMEKPDANRRTTVLTLEEFKKILRATPDHEFRWLLEFSWDCGTRPFEVKMLEARHVDLGKRRCVIPVPEAKGKKRVRVFYLATERSVRIIKRLMAEHPTGPLFRNTRGRPWTGFAVSCRFADLEKALGRRFRQYDWRHTWITRKLLAGVDSHIVAKLAGHTDSRMLDTVYSHVAEDYEFMLEAAKKDVK